MRVQASSCPSGVTAPNRHMPTVSWGFFAPMNDGWIKLHRRIVEHPRFTRHGWINVWLYLLCNATHKPIEKMFAGKIIILQPGQLITGRKKISENTRLTEDVVRSILSEMKTDQQITQQTSNVSSLITITNWIEYQENPQQIPQPFPNESPTNPQPFPTVQEYKNIRMKEVPPTPPTLDGDRTFIPNHHKAERINGKKHSYDTFHSAFKRFWDAYPNASNPEDTQRAFVEKNGVENIDVILKALEWQIKSDRWKREGGRFIPSSANYLRDSRWKDKNTDPSELSRLREYERQNEITRKLCAQPLPE